MAELNFIPIWGRIMGEGAERSREPLYLATSLRQGGAQTGRGDQRGERSAKAEFSGQGISLFQL